MTGPGLVNLIATPATTGAINVRAVGATPTYHSRERPSIVEDGSFRELVLLSGAGICFNWKAGWSREQESA